MHGSIWRRIGMQPWLIVTLLCGMFALGEALSAADERGVTVAGRVLDSSGRPIAGARVDVAEEVDAHAAAVLTLSGRSRPDAAVETATDDEGWFSLRAPSMGFWRVRIDSHGFVPMSTVLVPLIAPRVLGAVRLVAANEVAVTVVDAAGVPIAGAQLKAESVDSDRWSALRRDGWWPASRTLLTDDAGRAQILRAEGEAIRLRAFAPGFRFSTAQVIDGAHRKRPVSFTLPHGLGFDVVFTDHDGRPMADAAVHVDGVPMSILGDDGRATFHGQPKTPIECQVVTRDGRFERFTFDGPPDGKKEGEEGADGAPPDGGPPDGGPPDVAPKVVRLPAPVIVGGQVVSVETRAPVSDALVWNARHPRRGVWTDRSGAYRLVVREKGSVTLSGAAPGFGEGATVVQLAGPGETEAPSLSLRPTRVVEGRVMDADGMPIAGVDLTAIAELSARHGRRYSGGGMPQKTLSLPDGSFRLTGLEGVFQWRLRAEKDGFAPALVSIEPGTPVDVTLHPPRRVIGQVEDDAQRPIVGVEVAMVPLADMPTDRFAMRLHDDEDTSARTHTDAEGRFVLDSLSPGAHVLALTHASHADQLEARVDVDSEQIETDLGILRMDEAAPIEGRVVDAQGQPVADATVGWLAEAFRVGAMQTYQLRQRLGLSQRVKADEAGRFRIGSLAAADRVRLIVRAEGYANAEPRSVAAPTETPIEIVLERGGTIAGIVVDDSGAPIEGAAVTSIVREGFEMRDHQATRTEADGRFALRGIAAGTAQVEARKDGHPSGHRTGIEVRSGTAIEDLRIVLEAAGTLYGTVTDAARRPIPGASLMVSSAKPLRMISPESASADGDGNFRLHTSALGPHKVTVTHEGFQNFEKAVDLKAGETRFDVVLESGQQIVGVVLDVEGAPVPNAELRLDDGSLHQRWSQRVARAGADGSFRIDAVSAGSYRIEARGDGYAPERSEPIEVTAGGDPPYIELRLGRGATLEGIIRGLDAVDRTRLVVSATRGHMSNMMADARPASINAEGDAFTIRGLAPGTWAVRGEIRGHSRFATAQVKVVAGDAVVPVELVFGAGHTLSGTVTRAGEPVAGVMVWVSNGAINLQATTDTDGRFSLEGLADGTVLIMLSETGRDGWQQRQVTIDGDVEEDFELAGAAIIGRVVDPAGRPVAGAQVHARIDASEGPMMPRIQLTDAEGRFVLEDVEAGSYSLVVTHADHALARQPVAVVANTPVEVTVQLDSASPVRIAVQRFDGRAPGEVTVNVLDSAGQVLNRTRAPVVNGVAEIDALPVGTWRVAMTARDTAWAEATVSVAADRGATLADTIVARIDLAPGAALSVRVPDLAIGIAKARLTVRDAQGNDLVPVVSREPGVEGVTLWSGRTSLTGMVPGTWWVEARAEDGRTWQQVVEAPPGQIVEATLE